MKDKRTMITKTGKHWYVIRLIRQEPGGLREVDRKCLRCTVHEPMTMHCENICMIGVVPNNTYIKVSSMVAVQ